MGEVLRDPHQQIAVLSDVEARGEDRLQRLLLLVGGNGGEQFGMAELDPALVKRRLDGPGQAGKRQAAIELGFGPTEATGGLGAVVLARGKNANGRIGLLGFRGIVAHVVLVDRRLESLLVGHLADDDRHLALRPEGFERRPVATSTRNDQVRIIRLLRRTDQYGLEHPAQPQRSNKFVMLAAVEIATGVISGPDAGERQRGDGRGRRGDQRGYPGAEAAGAGPGHQAVLTVAVRLRPGMRGSS